MMIAGNTIRETIETLSSLISCYKLPKIESDQEKNTLKSKLDEHRKLRDSFSFDFRHNINIDKDRLNKDEIEREHEKYKLIGKLSLDLYIDYEYYREFSIKNKSQFENCTEELMNLGYDLREGDEWVNVKRPNIDAIIDQIFTSHFYQSILRQMTEKISIDETDQNKCEGTVIVNCVICETELGEGELICSVCGHPVSMIANHTDKGDNEVIISTNSKETDQWKCGICESLNPGDQSICDNCLNLSNEKKLFTNNFANCNICRNNKEIIDEGMCVDCFSHRYSDWVCSYRFCTGTNNNNDKYCQSCGIKRLSELNIGNFIERCMNGKYDHIWICRKCYSINEMGKEMCSQCCSVRVDERPEVTSNERVETVVIWKCERCGFTNDISYLSCNQCQWVRIARWNCLYCTKENEVRVQYCDACGWRNESIKNECEKCKQDEIIAEGLCGNCLTDWICSYKLCQNINNAKEMYCKRCGIDRRSILEHGSVIWKNINGKRDPVWICELCGGINKWESYYCQKRIESNRLCNSEKNKYYKWCKVCENQNQKFNARCNRCKQRL